MSPQLERLNKARLWLTARVPFLGYLTLQLKFEITQDPSIPTAGVTIDGYVIGNENFLATLSDAELRFVLGHEVLHVALLFWDRLGHKDRMLFNIAHDYVINMILSDFMARIGKGMQMPKGALFDEIYRNESAESIYAKLVAGGKNVDGFMPNDCQKKWRTEKGKQAIQGDSSAMRTISNHWKNILEAAAQTHESREKDSLPGALQQIIKDIREPKVTWQTMLSRWIGSNTGKSDTSYMRPSRRGLALDLYLPGVVRSGFPDVTVLWDTSGSMHGLASEILAEVAAITTELGLQVRLIVCDTIIHADVSGLSLPEEIVPNLIGGGGSDFCPAFDRLQEEGNDSVVLAFTDGYIDVPKTQPPSLKGVLWVLTETSTRPAPWGLAIKLTANGYAENL
jgi:predicted metal-dependent peptidase